LFADNGDGERWPKGEAGEMALCGWDGASDGDPEARILSGMFVSDARRINLLEPMPCFDMNLSNQDELVNSRRESPEARDVNASALSFNASLVTTMPFFFAF
jgi:hypothetical protein